MKIRNGFVSNSSSTSYLISLPKNFNIDKVLSEKNIQRIKSKTESKWQIEYLDKNKNLKEDLEYLLEKGFVTSDDGYGNEGDNVCFQSLLLLLNDYVFKNIECGADNESTLVLIDRSRSKGKKLSEIKPPKKDEKPERDPNYKPKDYPNEVKMLKPTDEISEPRFKRARAKPNCKSKVVTRIV